MNLSRHFNMLMTSALSVSLAVTPMAGIGIARAQNAPAAEAPGDAGWQKEFEAWRSASKAGKAADYEMYLKAYPTGKFASVAKKRIGELQGTTTADAAKVDKQQTAVTAQADTTAVRSADASAADAEKQRDLEMWRQVSKTGKQADYEKYLKAFPKGKFAKVAKTRIDALIAAATAPGEQQTAEVKQKPAQQDDQNQADDQAQTDDQNQADDSNSQVTEQATPDDQADQQDQAQDQSTVKKNSQQEDQAQAPASDWEQEYALWKAASDGNTVKEYEAYLKAYPNGKFAAIAQARIVQLAAAEQPATNVDEGDDTQAEQKNKMKQNQQADDQNQQSDDQNQQADDQSQQPDDQNQQAQDQNQQNYQGQDDQNQTADNQTDDQSQQNNMGQTTQDKQQIQYTQGTPDTEDEFLNREGRHEMQGRLTSLGYDTGGSDGSFGPNTRTAISTWQQDNGAPVSGYLSGDQIAQIRIQSQVSYTQWLSSQTVVVRPRREKIIVEERHPGVDAAIAVGVLGAVVGAHRFKNRPGRVKVIEKFKFKGNFFGGCRRKRRC